MRDSSNQNRFDIIIAGGGLAGLLALTRFRQIHPNAKILLIEKENKLGGRLRVSDGKENRGAGGLNFVSRDLLEFLNQTLIGCSKSEDEFALLSQNSERLGIMQGKKLDEVPLEELVSAKFAKILGGPSAVKHLESFLESLRKRSEDMSFQALGKALNISRKDPFLDVLNIMSIPLGITNPWLATVQSFEQRTRYIQQGLFGGPWTKMIDHLFTWSEPSAVIGKSILDSHFDKNQWTLNLENEQVEGKILVITQSPWEALPWLKREHAPGALVNTALKYSPMSVVSLFFRLDQDVSSPGRILIPSEKSQIFKLLDNEYCVQVIIDYETFLDAPRVVQAVKQAKRSRTKYCRLLGVEDPREEFLSLRPVAWAHDTSVDARKHVEDFDAAKLNSKNLVFCGDSFGASYDPDQNLIKSLLAACSTAVL